MRTLFVIPFCCLSLLLAGFANAASLRIGTISQIPVQDIREFQPLADYLASNLSALGIDKGEVVTASSMKEMAALLKAGKVDLYIDSPFPMLAVQRHAAIDILLRRWKKGTPDYYSVIFVRKDSGITTLEQLQGKTLAFEEQFSTSSYLLPKATLRSAGLSVVEKSQAQSHDIAYTFSDNDTNTVAWVVKKQVAAGAISNVKFDKLPPRLNDELTVIHRSMAVPRHLLSCRHGMKANWVGKIRELLLGMEKNPAGQKALLAFGETTRFDALPAESANELAQIEKLARLIESELEQ